MNVIAKIVTADLRCSLVRNPTLHYRHTLNTSQVISHGLYRHSLHVISAASLVEASVMAYILSFKKYVWMLIFIGGGGGGGWRWYILYS